MKIPLCFFLPGTTDDIIQYFSCKMKFFSRKNNSTEHYQFTSKAAVIKLSF